MIHEYKVTQSGIQGEKKLRKTNRTSRDLWDNSKWSSIWVSGYQEERRKWTIYFKIMPPKFPNLVKNIDLHRQKAHWTTSEINIKKTTPACMTIKLLKAKDKEKTVKRPENKNKLYKGRIIRLWLTLHQKLWKPEDTETTFEIKEKLVSQELHTEESYNSKLKMK